MNIIEGKLVAEKAKVAIVASRFNDFIVSKLIDGATDSLIRHGLASDDITIVKVPGAFEIPLAAKKIGMAKDVEAVICLGAVIRGSTPHFDYVCAEVSKGVASVGLELGKPVIFGVITADSVEQAMDRAGVKSGNKGSDAAVSAIEMINLLRNIDNKN